MTDAPDGARGLERERHALSKLAAEARLKDLYPLLPEVLGAGSDSGWTFLVQARLPGTPATLRAPKDGPRILSQASALAARLHTLTAVPRTVGQPEVAEWIERPIQVVRELLDSHRDPFAARTLDRLARELGAAVGRATMPLGWIHGDFWSDNILVEVDGISGIVDWDSASDAGLALHDQLHLVLYWRKVQRGTPIGTEICRALGSEPRWDQHELSALLAGTGGLPGSDEVSRRRLGITLYWLRLVATNLSRQPGMTRSRRWLDDNVRAVLACL
jgi:aminoglycoside phosphotransferase (APT) family kinase protein